ncbi:hypothetical protein PHET_07916 [Paragonimus heterotremus]|uniref:Uncharacterized protein n=1 Tax=Paragonimus heterotremus TaxID=100268 RepID=A0A8J4SUX3_9TREM|nr:hypothetical protein PHET_07916 [Paragonimus heterotremus]
MVPTHHPEIHRWPVSSGWAAPDSAVCLCVKCTCARVCTCVRERATVLRLYARVLVAGVSGYVADRMKVNETLLTSQFLEVALWKTIHGRQIILTNIVTIYPPTLLIKPSSSVGNE